MSVAPTPNGRPVLPLRARAPAKLNLCLYVGARRADGLHEICSLFCSIALADDIRIESAPGRLDKIVCPGVDGPNIAAEALAAFRERFGWEETPLRVAIHKRIPVAAGLGGGSADAAAVLRLAVAASGLRPAPDVLSELALSLGADVPSQLEPGAQLVRGAGEQIERLELPAGLAAVLLVGEAKLSTGHVYSHADTLGTPRNDLDRIAAQLRSAARSASGLDAFKELAHNDLERAAVDLEPSAGRALELLHQSGAEAALVTGSGPAAFGLYRDGEQAERARVELKSEWDGEVIATGPAPPGYGEPQPVGGGEHP